MDIKKVGVLGCGLMGSGIAQVAASAGCDVVVKEVSQELLDKGFKGIDRSLAKFVEKGKLTADEKDATMSRLKGTIVNEDLADCDIIIEVIIENLDIKRETYAALDRICKPETIFASNTSILSITEMLTSTSPERQRRFIGMHFFNPVPVMQLVELIRGLQTSDATYAAVEEVSKAVGKSPVQVRNSPGFVVNRMLCPMINEAIFALGEGLATAAQIDEAMKLGAHMVNYIRASATTPLAFREIETALQVTREQVNRALSLMRIFGFVSAFVIEREDMRAGLVLSSLQRLRLLEAKDRLSELSHSLPAAQSSDAAPWSPQ